MSVGHEVCQKLLECNNVNELDAAIKIVNDFYKVYYQHLEILGYLDKGLRVALTDLDTGKYEVVKK